jgi:hypothetical protein
MSKKINVTIEGCDDCFYYEYIRSNGYDCIHSEAPQDNKRGNEPLAENRIGTFPKWCPLDDNKERNK